MLTLILLAAAILLFFYPFVGYPVLLTLLARRWKPIAPPIPDERDLPRLTLLICALNEEKIIRAKVENCLALEYPREKLRVVIVSDGSVDRTAEIVKAYASQGIELIERAQRRGKVSNLNDVVPSLDSEIVVFSDANVIYDRRALLYLVSHFGDPTVGCTSGQVILTGTTEPLQESEQSYYSIEWKLQEAESRIYAMVGCDGAMYAMRRHLFSLCPNDTIIEDFVMALAVVRQGSRVIFEPRAKAWEEGPKTLQEEYRRKVRIAAGAAQAMLRGGAWPAGAPASFWFLFLSHKFLRWITPLVGLAIIVLALLSRDFVLSQLVLAGTALIAVLAAVRLFTGWANALVDAPFYFLFGQCAVVVGLFKGATGKQSVLWRKANR